jgi:hypothetical protein
MYKNASHHLLFDGKFPGPAILAFGLVDTSIGTAANETHDLVALGDSLLVVVTREHSRVCRIYAVFRRRFSTRPKAEGDNER